MINIKTKSIQEKKSKTDGIRICVMRRIRPDYNFDLWIPSLAPSEILLKKYVIDKTMSWNTFSQLYTRQVLQKQKQLINTLIYLSKRFRVTLLCQEKSATRCHRSLLLTECKRLISKNCTKPSKLIKYLSEIQKKEDK